jgi:hypothetical protein
MIHGYFKATKFLLGGFCFGFFLFFAQNTEGPPTNQFQQNGFATYRLGKSMRMLY